MEVQGKTVINNIITPKDINIRFFLFFISIPIYNNIFKIL